MSDHIHNCPVWTCNGCDKVLRYNEGCSICGLESSECWRCALCKHENNFDSCVCDRCREPYHGQIQTYWICPWCHDDNTIISVGMQCSHCGYDIEINEPDTIRSASEEAYKFNVAAGIAESARSVMTTAVEAAKAETVAAKAATEAIRAEAMDLIARLQDEIASIYAAQRMD